MRIGRAAILSYCTLSMHSMLVSQNIQVNGFSVNHHLNLISPRSLSRTSHSRTTAAFTSAGSGSGSGIGTSYTTTSTTSSTTTTSTSSSIISSQMSISPLEETGSTSSSSRAGRSSEEIERELSSGRILEDGPVIDFGSVKDSSSTAEKALAQARQEYLQNLHQHNTQPPPQKHQTEITQQLSQQQQQQQQQRLMGINDEVVSEVGREVGAFVNDDQLIQKCASYLRSKAPTNMFQPHEQTSSSSSNLPTSTTEEEQLNSLLRQSYMESGLVTEAFAKTFYLGTQLLPQEAREAIWAVYVWCRRTDEIVDAPRKPGDVSMLTDLSQWEIRLENLFTYGIVEDVLDLPLLDCKIKYPNLPIEPFVDMIRGMLMDIPDLGQDRYDTFEELHLYCYRVAGTVGLMSMPVFGCAPGFTEDEAK
jgi:phytoene synthase